jgi:membrane associated rhomboid family serine protease
MEKAVGTVRFVIVYFTSGIMGFILGANFAGNGIASTGCSGSLFGIIAIVLLVPSLPSVPFHPSLFQLLQLYFCLLAPLLLCCLIPVLPLIYLLVVNATSNGRISVTTGTSTPIQKDNSQSS